MGHKCHGGCCCLKDVDEKAEAEKAQAEWRAVVDFDVLFPKVSAPDDAPAELKESVNRLGGHRPIWCKAAAAGLLEATYPGTVKAWIAGEHEAAAKQRLDQEARSLISGLKLHRILRAQGRDFSDYPVAEYAQDALALLAALDALSLDTTTHRAHLAAEIAADTDLT